MNSAPDRKLWPTTTTGDDKASGALSYPTDSGRHSGTTLTDAATEWADPIHDENIEVTVFDLATGAAAKDSRWSAYWWAEGNGSCDCNRGIPLGHPLPDGGVCVGCHRYVVVEAPQEHYSLREFNEGYLQDAFEEAIRRYAESKGGMA